MSSPGFHAGNGQRTGRFQHRTGIFKNIFDGGADGIVINPNHFIDISFGDAETFVAHLLNGGTIGKEAHLIKAHTMPGGQRLGHGIGIDGFDTNDLDFGTHLFNSGSHSGNKTATTDTTENGIDRFGVLAHDLQTRRTLTGNHIRIIKGMHEGQAFFLFQAARFVVGIVKRLTKQHHFATPRTHRINLDARCGRWHNNDGTTTQLLGRQRHTLSMIASGSCDYAALECIGR